MSSQPRFLASAVRTIVLGLITGVVLVGAAWKLEFPPVFLKMFAAYAALGTAVFILLEAPPMKPLTGIKALASLVGFYTIISAAYIVGASAWPQYDPDDEKSKIDKLLKVKREKAAQEQALVDESLKRAAALEEKAQALIARLDRLAPETVPSPAPAAAPAPSGGNLIARGMEVYELHECYNCHKIGGKGGVKKRGPELDNVGNLLTIEDIKKKIFDPTYLYAEGFEKEHKKGVMPDKYKELMSEEELAALAAYLSTLKNPAVATPKPIYVKTKVEHGFIVYGYVRDAEGKPLAGVEVQAKPLKEHAHAASAKTNAEGYYEIFLHLHNEDSGTTITVSAKGAQKEIVANYDPNDKVTKRQAAVDLTTS
jgi:mono/diheme cytochrome c family protein